MSDLISVIIPVYNARAYLAQCLDSVLCQTHENLDIILVNDGSTDQSGKICDEYAMMDRRITVIHKENGGVSSARNMGLDAAAGKWIAFVDSDDYISPDMLLSLHESCIKSGSSMSMCGYFTENSRGVRQSNIPLPVEGILSPAEAYENILIPPRFEGFLWNKMFSGQIIREHGMKLDENIHYCEDLLFVCLYLKRCNRISFTTKPYYHYRINDSSASQNINSKFITGVDAFERIVRETEDTEYSGITKAAAANFAASMFAAVCKTQFYTPDLKAKLTGMRKAYAGEFKKYPFRPKQKVIFACTGISPRLFAFGFRFLKSVRNILRKSFMNRG